MDLYRSGEDFDDKLDVFDDYLIYENGLTFSEMVLPQPSDGKSTDYTSVDTQGDDSSDDFNEHSSSFIPRTESMISLASSNGSKKRIRNTKNISEDQKVERRDRNREHAKRSRLRKKSMLKTLQISLENLQGENSRLRQVLRENVENADKLIAKYFKDMSQSLIVSDSKEILQRSQQQFLVRVNSDLELITNLLN